MLQAAATTPDDPDEVPAIETLVAAHPLPEGVEDEDINLEDLAKAFDVSVNSVRKWVDQPGFPVMQRGAHGRAYVVRLSHAYAWRMAQQAEANSKRARINASVQALQASFLGFERDNPAAALTPKQRRELAEADLAHSKAGLQRGVLVPLADILDLFESVFSIVRDGIEGMPDQLERELALKPEEVAVAQRIAEDIQTAMADQIEAAEIGAREIPDEMPRSQLLI